MWFHYPAVLLVTTVNTKNIGALLFISSKKIDFCSDRSIQLASPQRDNMRVHYKIKRVNRAIDETIDKEQVGKTTDLANRVIIEISVTRYTHSFRLYVSSSLKRRMATKKMMFPLQSIKRGTCM
ncbi:unnamed protein product [Brassica oleracea]